MKLNLGKGMRLAWTSGLRPHRDGGKALMEGANLALRRLADGIWRDVLGIEDGSGDTARTQTSKDAKEVC